MEVILSNLPPLGLFLSSLLGTRVLKMLLAGGAVSCVTTSINTTTWAVCKGPGMAGSDLMQGGKPGQPGLVACVESSLRAWQEHSTAGAGVLWGRALGEGFGGASGNPQAFLCLYVTWLPDPRTPLQSTCVSVLGFRTEHPRPLLYSTPAFRHCALEGLQASSEGLFDNI